MDCKCTQRAKESGKHKKKAKRPRNCGTTKWYCILANIVFALLLEMWWMSSKLVYDVGASDLWKKTAKGDIDNETSMFAEFQFQYKAH